MSARAVISMLAGAALLAAAAVGPAAAYQGAGRTLAGPSGDVIDLGGAAMASDGTGGVAYRARVDGHAHVFVRQLVGGRWGPPQQLDRGQRYDSSWPRLAAGRGGRLVATWVHENGTDSDRLFAARLNTGSSGWGAPVVVDPNVGESLATYPSIAVAPDGTALIAYIARVPIPANPDGTRGPLPPTGYAQAEVRLARLRGTAAAVLPPLNRDVSRALPDPDVGSAPKVAVDANGAGVVAWQEPDDGNIPRVYARRIAGGGLGTQQQVSPAALGGQPLPAATHGFDLALAGDGEGAVAYRQLPIAASAVASERVLVSRLRSPGPGRDSTRFGPPVAADGLGDLGRPRLAPSALPDVGVSDDGVIGIALGRAGRALLGFESDGPVSPSSVGDLPAGSAAPAVVVGRSGASVAAWGMDQGGGSVAVAERAVGDAPRVGRASALFPGPVDAISLGGSGGGDAIVAFQQGRGELAQIGATVVDGPPAAFAVDEPSAWQRAADARVTWSTAIAAAGPVQYRLYVDGHRAGAPATRRSAPLGDSLDDGPHRVRVIAADTHGQQTTTPERIVRTDATAPSVSFTQRGLSLGVRVADGDSDHASGVDENATVIAFGDGGNAAGATATHRYKHAGVALVTATVVDRAGNRRVVRRRIEVRP
jgi:hypothetical protein